MLDDRVVVGRVEQIRDIASRHGGTVVFDLPPPARPADVAVCEAFFGAPLATSLKEYWGRHDGMSIHVYGPGYPPESGLAAFVFDLRSTTGTVIASQSLRNFFAGMRASGNEEFSEAEARRYVDFVDLEDSGRYTLLDLRRREPASGEAPVVDVDNEDWFAGEFDPIASSVGEFIERCLDFMIETECGFRYWRGTEDGW